ncbi:MAG: heat shock protein Hsp 20 family [Verrucomicrobiales bacterium]|jgi:HSP20 family protein|nr:heat shock protein Hsp 20 family [Verrucomicrobiales bacterium]MDB6131101.1 heat shock protein Hsp 20 family [Verrucomicrobiales bacterium]
MNTIVEQSKKAQSNEHAAKIRYAAPVVNIYENKEGYLLEAEMPGVSKESLEVTLEGTQLTLVGHKSVAALPGSSLYRESQQVDYKRSFELDPSINAEAIKAKVENGVLSVHLPKTEKLKPRKIEIGA